MRRQHEAIIQIKQEKKKPSYPSSIVPKVRSAECDRPPLFFNKHSNLHACQSPQHKEYARFSYTLKNKNITNVQYDCKYKRSCMPFCEAKLRLMFPSGTFSEDRPVVSGTHSRDCCVFNGGDLQAPTTGLGVSNKRKSLLRNRQICLQK